MKFFFQIIVIALLAYLFELFLPWWSIALAAAIGGYWLRSGKSFLAGFLSISLLWTFLAWRIDVNNPTQLADKVAAIMHVSKPMLMGIMALIGGITGGFAAMTGSYLRKKKRRY